MKFPRRQFVCSLIGLALVPFTRRRKPKPTTQPVQVVDDCHLNVDASEPFPKITWFDKTNLNNPDQALIRFRDGSIDIQSFPVGSTEPVELCNATGGERFKLYPPRGLHMPPDGVVLWKGKPVDLNDIPPDLHVYLKHHPAEAEVFWKIADRCREWSHELALGRAMRH